MTGPVEADWTSLVEFLEARIAEQESAIREGTFALGTADVPGRDDKVSLGQLMLEECAQKRAIIAQAGEGMPAAEGTRARRPPPGVG